MHASLRAIVLAAVAGACTATAPPPLPPTLAYPDFMYPTAAPAGPAQTTAIDRGWRYLQGNDLGAAEKEFGLVAQREPELPAGPTGLAFVDVARKDYPAALSRFNQALMRRSTYVPALMAKGQLLVVLGRDEEAIATFESALAADRTLESLQPRIELLRFRVLQALIASARDARADGRLDDAVRAYTRAGEASPDSAVIYKELGTIERGRGNGTVALEHFRRAAELDPSDPFPVIQAAELLQAARDFAAAERAYRDAARLEPNGGFDARAETMAALVREGRLPAEFQAIPQAPTILRGDLAALIGVRLESTLQGARRSAVVTTDTRGHWAAAWIGEVVATDVMPPFDDHTFRPRATLRRVELAQAVSALLTVAGRGNPSVQAQLSVLPAIADVAQSHLNYRAVAAAVATGVMPLLQGNRFNTEQAVSGAEAVAALDRLRALIQTR